MYTAPISAKTGRTRRPGRRRITSGGVDPPEWPHSTDTCNGRTYITRIATYTGGARCAGCARPRRTPPVRGRSPRSPPPPATRRYAPPRAIDDARREGSSSPRRAPRRRCRPARRPQSRPTSVPRCRTACRYLPRTEGRSGGLKTTARDIRATAGRQGRSASTRSLRAAARLPARRARSAHACICERQHRDASSLSRRGQPDHAGARQVAGEGGREQQNSAADSVGSRHARRGGSEGGRRTARIGRARSN